MTTATSSITLPMARSRQNIAEGVKIVKKTVGRPPINGVALMTTINVRVTNKQRGQFQKLGGANWLRKLLDNKGEAKR